MKAQTMFLNVFSKAALAALALGGFLLLAGAPAAKANDWDDCHRRVAYSDWRYQEAVERHEARERAVFYRQERREHHRDRDDRYRRDWDRR
jgi:hypothetical protein